MFNKFGLILLVISTVMPCYAYTATVYNNVDGAGVIAFGAEVENSVHVLQGDSKQLTFKELPVTVSYDNSSQPSLFFSIQASTNYWCSQWPGNGIINVQGTCDKNWLGFCKQDSTISLQCG